MFAAMSLYLLARSGGDGLERPHVFPWPLAPESSVMYGFIFSGAAVYFLIGAIEGRWAMALSYLLTKPETRLTTRTASGGLAAS